MLKKLLLIGSAFSLCYAGNPKMSLNEILEREQCPIGSYKGMGMADEESAAMDIARAEIALNISGSISVNSEYVNEVKNERDSEQWKKQISRNVSLDNAQDAKLHFSKRQDGKIGVVACMSRADLVKHYKNRIASLFSFADKEFIIADYLIEQGKKNAALAKIQAIEDSLKNANTFATRLQSLEGDNSYFEKERAYWQKANSMKMQLQHGTTVHLDISAKDFSDLGDRLAAQMQEKGCNCTITESRESADYQVTVKAKMGTCMDNRNTPNRPIYCYASATVTVNNSKYQKPVNVNIPEAKGGWMHGNKEKALEETFKELVKILAEKITQTINQ